MINRGLNVRQAERLVQNAKAASGGTRKATAPADPDRPKDTDTLALERDLTALLGLKVSIRFQGNGGSLTIHYKTLEQQADGLHRSEERRVGKAGVSTCGSRWWTEIKKKQKHT